MRSNLTIKYFEVGLFYSWPNLFFITYNSVLTFQHKNLFRNLNLKQKNYQLILHFSKDFLVKIPWKNNKCYVDHVYKSLISGNTFLRVFNEKIIDRDL